MRNTRLSNYFRFYTIVLSFLYFTTFIIIVWRIDWASINRLLKIFPMSSVHMAFNVLQPLNNSSRSYKYISRHTSEAPVISFNISNKDKKYSKKISLEFWNSIFFDTHDAQRTFLKFGCPWLKYAHTFFTSLDGRNSPVRCIQLEKRVCTKFLALSLNVVSV